MKNKQPSLFKKIDQAITDQLSTLGSSQFTSRLNDLFDHLNPEVRRVLSQITGLTIVFLPFLICLIFLVINFNKKSSLETKQQILDISLNYLQKKSETYSYSKKIIADEAILNEQELRNIIKDDIPKDEKSPFVFTLKNFTREEITSQVTKTSAEIEFEAINLADFIRIITNNLKNSSVKISDIEVNKGELGKLSGFFRVIQYARLNEETEKSITNEEKKE